MLRCASCVVSWRALGVLCLCGCVALCRKVFDDAVGGVCREDQISPTLGMSQTSSTSASEEGCPATVGQCHKGTVRAHMSCTVMSWNYILARKLHRNRP